MSKAAGAFVLGGLGVYGLYQLARIEVLPRPVYDFLGPLFSPTLAGWAFHLVMLVAGLGALVLAIREYRRAASDVLSDAFWRDV